AVKYDQHHRTALLHLHGPRASPALLKLQPPQRRRVEWLCGIAAPSSTSAAARRGSVAMRNRAFRVTPARFLLGAAVNPADGDQVVFEMGWSGCEWLTFWVGGLI